METDPSPVRLWSAADSEARSDGYWTAFPSESEEMARTPTRAHTAPQPSLEHDAEALERPTRARTAPVARHTEPKRDNMGDTPMAEESEARGTVGCAGSGGKRIECHCEQVSFLIGKYPKMGMDAIVQHPDRLDNQKDVLEEDIAGIRMTSRKRRETWRSCERSKTGTGRSWRWPCRSSSEWWTASSTWWRTCRDA